MAESVNYRRITKHIAGRLNLLESYAFYCLAMKSDYKTMDSHVTEESLAEYYGIKDCDQIRKYLNKMQECGVVAIDKREIKGQFGMFRKNRYTLDAEAYVWITRQLHDEPIKRELKGFLILLRCLCFSTTLQCHYSQATIAEKLNIGRSTVSRHMAEAIEMGYVEHDEEKGYFKLLREDIFIPTQRTEEDVTSIILNKAKARHIKKKEQARKDAPTFIL